jgi:2-C-methyl-D-erythritol 4-phosphate cytidylyltransferase/2-C-methyl-D-erythritol 2,4-cyclodiphosphate synthase
MTGKTVALIVAAGQGHRMGAVPKQFMALGGKAVVAHSHAAFTAHPAIDDVIVLIAEGQQQALAEALGDVPHLIGGVLRRDSVRIGLEALAGDPPDRVLVHDAARPFVPAAAIDNLLAALDHHDGAVPMLHVADTLARADATLGEVVPRDGLVRVQTPQAFRYDAIRAAHQAWPTDEDATDDAQMVRRHGGTVALVEGDAMLDKLTWPADFAAAERRIAGGRTRAATGYDVHRLVAGEELWLCGVLIPHDKGLSGHSDADVALHAITDAVLGTIGAGDIGMHFPPSDPKWRGAESGQFLAHAASLVAAKGGSIDFIDVTLICEAPRIGPYREAMRARVAAILGIAPGQVSLKATTSERLGFTGRGEGIAAQAIATVRLP